MKGKIYRLSNGDKHYYGSTTKDLKTRLKNHISNIEDEIHGTSSSILFDSVVYNVSIDLMEEIEYENKDELLWLERWWIENNECVNQLMPIRTNEERKEYIKYNNHNSHIRRKNDNERWKKCLEQKKEYAIRNNVILKEKKRKYYEQNKEVIRKQQSEKVKCECGFIGYKNHLARHRKTKKHIKLMENKTENIKITITAEQPRHGQAD